MSLSRLMLTVKVAITEYKESDNAKLKLLVPKQHNIWALTGNRSRRSIPNVPGGKLLP